MPPFASFARHSVFFGISCEFLCDYTRISLILQMDLVDCGTSGDGLKIGEFGCAMLLGAFL